MTARASETGADAPDPQAGEAAVTDVQSRTRREDRARRRERSDPCDHDPFVAFTEWAGPADEDDYADLQDARVADSDTGRPRSRPAEPSP